MMDWEPCSALHAFLRLAMPRCPYPLPTPVHPSDKLIVRTALRHLARQDEVQQRSGLRDQLTAAADKLEGPWQE